MAIRLFIPLFVIIMIVGCTVDETIIRSLPVDLAGTWQEEYEIEYEMPGDLYDEPFTFVLPIISQVAFDEANFRIDVFHNEVNDLNICSSIFGTYSVNGDV
jgi:hypothetical protein